MLQSRTWPRQRIAEQLSAPDVPELATMETPSCSRPGPTGATGRRRLPRRSWTRRRSSARENGLAVRHALAENDSHRFVVALGDLVVTGPTGSTLMDL
jgi:MOFRL family